jgi:sterol 3beta-glucosyltransferase
MAQKQQERQREVRISDGVEAVKKSTPAQRAEVIQKFKQMKSGTKERQKKYKEIAEAEMYEEQQGSNEGEGESGSTSPQSTSPSSAQQSAPTPQTSEQSTEDEEDATFTRELEMAKELSLAEERGYQRALAQMNRPEGSAA